MQHGGRRPGAGRKPGSLSKKTREIAERASSDGITPLEVMVEAMRDLYDQGDKVAAAQVAKDAAPYMHPRLQQIEQHSKVEMNSTVSADPLNPEEWERQHGGAHPTH